MNLPPPTLSSEFVSCEFITVSRTARHVVTRDCLVFFLNQTKKLIIKNYKFEEELLIEMLLKIPVVYFFSEIIYIYD